MVSRQKTRKPKKLMIIYKTVMNLALLEQHYFHSIYHLVSAFITIHTCKSIHNKLIIPVSPLNIKAFWWFICLFSPFTHHDLFSFYMTGEDEAPSIFYTGSVSLK